MTIPSEPGLRRFRGLVSEDRVSPGSSREPFSLEVSNLVDWSIFDLGSELQFIDQELWIPLCSWSRWAGHIVLDRFWEVSYRTGSGSLWVWWPRVWAVLAVLTALKGWRPALPFRGSCRCFGCSWTFLPLGLAQIGHDYLSRFDANHPMVHKSEQGRRGSTMMIYTSAEYLIKPEMATDFFIWLCNPLFILPIVWSPRRWNQPIIGCIPLTSTMTLLLTSINRLNITMMSRKLSGCHWDDWSGYLSSL